MAEFTGAKVAKFIEEYCDLQGMTFATKSDKRKITIYVTYPNGLERSTWVANMRGIQHGTIDNVLRDLFLKVGHWDDTLEDFLKGDKVTLRKSKEEKTKPVEAAARVADVVETPKRVEEREAVATEAAVVSDPVKVPSPAGTPSPLSGARLSRFGEALRGWETKYPLSSAEPELADEAVAAVAAQDEAEVELAAPEEVVVESHQGVGVEGVAKAEAEATVVADEAVEETAEEGADGEMNVDTEAEAGDASQDDVGLTPVQRAAALLDHLRQADIIGPKDDVRKAAQMLADLLAGGPMSVGQDRSLADRITFYLTRTGVAYGAAGLPMPLLCYRIWQAVALVGGVEISYSDFWGLKPKPAVKVWHAIGREIFTDNILPLLNLPVHQHILISETLNELTGYRDNAFGSFLSFPQAAYKSKKANVAEMTIDDIAKLGDDDLEPSTFLAKLAQVLGVKPAEIVSHDQWVRAFGDNPAAAMQERPFYKLRFDETQLDEASTDVMKRIRESGFRDMDELCDVLNQRVLRNAPGEAKKLLAVTQTIAHAVMEPNPYHVGLYMNILHSRITEVVNERLLERGDDLYSVDELFNVKRRKNTNSRTKLSVEAHNNLIAVLQWPENEHILSLSRLTWLINTKPQPFREKFRDVANAYSPAEDADDMPLASEVLEGLAAVLDCETTDIVPLDLWRRACALRDGVVLNAHESMREVATPASHFSPGQRIGSGDMSEFMANALAKQQERLDRDAAALQQARAGLLDVLHVRFMGLLTEPEPVVAVAAEEVPEPVVAAETIVGSPATAEVAPEPPVETEVVQSSPEVAEEARAADKVAAVAEIIEVVEAPIEPTLADVKVRIESEEVGAQFTAAALELVTHYRRLNTPETALSFTLLNRVEGIDRKKAPEDIASVAEALGFDSADEAADILAEIEDDLVQVVSKVAGGPVTAANVIEALRVYQRDINKRPVLNKFIDAGCDEAFDVAYGKSCAPPVNAEAVRGIRMGLLAAMASALKS